jgi:hypothetical protein
MHELRYGTKAVILWSGTTKTQCLESMRQFGEIVDDCLQRLRVDFGRTDLYMCLQVMDARAWLDVSPEKKLSLRIQARHLCEALGIEFEWQGWKRALAYVECRRRGRPDAGTVDNRELWAHAYETSRINGGPLASFLPLVSFFVSVTDGTGNVERFLGAHAAFLAHHVGAPDDDMSEVCLEIAREGPQTEAQVFYKDSQRPGVLLLTDWSRRCAQVWRCLYGRRFGCYKERKDIWIRNTGWRLRGSMKSVGVMQERATKALVAMAAADKAAGAQATPRSTLVGFDRGTLMRDVKKRDSTAPAGKNLLLSADHCAEEVDEDKG